MGNLNLKTVLLSSPEHTFYLSGYCGPTVGAQPVVLGIPIGREPVMIVAEHEEGGVKEKSWIKDIRTYAYYTITEHPDLSQQIRRLIIDALIEQNLSKLTKPFLGIEEAHIPFAFIERIREEIPGIDFKDFSPVLKEMRLVKSDEEIAVIKEAVRFCDMGQETMRRSLEEGMTEIELFTKVKSVLEIEAGGRISLEGDLVFGEGTEGGGDLPGQRRLQKNDLVMADFCVKINGYWGDITRTIVFGELSKKQKEIYHVVLEALNIGIEAVVPGIKASEIDRIVRNFIVKKGYGDYFPHHTGHGIGLTHFEAPMIVPHNDQVLKPGMIIAVEPGIYLPGIGGVRIEKDILITKEGKEELTGGV